VNHTLGGIVDRQAERQPARQALVYTDRSLRYSYQRFREGTDRVARGLLRIGVDPGDRVALWAGNLPEGCILQIAVAKLGAVLAPLHAASLEELERALRGSEAKALFFSSPAPGFPGAVAEPVRSLLPELEHCPRGQLHSERFPRLRSIATLGEEPYRGVYRFKDLIDLAEAIPKSRLAKLGRRLAPEEAALLEGNDLLSHGELIRAAREAIDRLAVVEADRICFAAPLFQRLGGQLALGLATVSGATLVPLLEPSAEPALAAVAQERCTILAAEPALLAEALQASGRSDSRRQSLRAVLVAPGSPADLRRTIESSWGVVWLSA
jgi:fatty-acyl-CoA synthase